MDERLLKEKLSQAVQESQIIQNFIHEKTPIQKKRIDEVTTEIIHTIQQAVLQSTPRLRISPRSKPGFTSECKEAVQEANRYWRRRDRFWSENAENKYKRARNDKIRVLRKTRRACFRK